MAATLMHEIARVTPVFSGTTKENIKVRIYKWYEEYGFFLGHFSSVISIHS